MNRMNRRVPRAAHTKLVALPLSFLATSVMFDLIGLATGAEAWTRVASIDILCGLAAGALAAIFGALDYRAIPTGTRASRAGLAHALMNTFALMLFTTSFVLRSHLHSGMARTWPVLASVIGLGLLFFSSWLGGELLELGARIRAPKHPLHWPPR
jgi:uncharacterized membrane protein